MSTFDYAQLYHITRRLQMQALDWDRTAQAFVSMAGEALGVTHGALMTFDPEQALDKIYVLVDADYAAQADREAWEIVWRRGLAGHVFHSKRRFVIRNLRKDLRWPKLAEQSASLLQDGSAVGIPLADASGFHGILLYLHPQVDYFKQAQLALLDELVAIGVDALHNAATLSAAQRPDARYEQLFSHSPVPIILTERDGIIRDVNAQASAYLGFSQQDLRHVPIHDLNIRAHEAYEKSFLNGKPKASMRASVYDMDGREIPTLLRIRLLELDGEALLEWVLQDMSAQMELEQLRKDLTAMVYHDLRSPLTSVILSNGRLLEMLREHDNPAVPRMLELGLRSAQQLQRMIESLLDIQRLEEQKVILNRDEVTVARLLEKISSLYNAMLNDSDQRLRLQIAPDVSTINIDVDLITRVLLNLVENAIKYTPDGGLIRIEAEEQGNYLRLSVIDTGPGIPETMRQRIFDKFSRVKYKDAPKGIGLGLAFCRLAVEAHGGQIWVDAHQRQGSAFRFTLPLYVTELPPTQPYAVESITQDATTD